MNNQNYRPCVGAVLTLIAAIYNFLRPLANCVIGYFQVYDLAGADRALAIYLPSFLSSLIIGLISAVPIILFSIRLIRRKRDNTNGGLAIVMSVLAFLTLVLNVFVYLAAKATGSSTTSYGPSVLVLPIAYVLLAVLCFSVTKPQPGGFVRLWFLPGVVYAVYAVLYFVQQCSNTLTYVSGFAAILTQVPLLPGLILYIIGYLLIGKWLVSPWQAGTALQQPWQEPGQSSDLYNSDVYNSEF